MIQDAVAIVTAVAVIFVVFQLVGDRTSRHREFENLYVQRYWNLMDQLSFDPQYLPPEAPISPQDRKLCLAYLRLCEDEVELRSQGYVTDQTWLIWAEGIKAQAGTGLFIDILKNQPEEQLPALRGFLRDGKDPLNKLFLVRWWSGLH